MCGSKIKFTKKTRKRSMIQITNFLNMNNIPVVEKSYSTQKHKKADFVSDFPVLERCVIGADFGDFELRFIEYGMFDWKMSFKRLEMPGRNKRKYVFGKKSKIEQNIYELEVYFSKKQTPKNTKALVDIYSGKNHEFRPNEILINDYIYSAKLSRCREITDIIERAKVLNEQLGQLKSNKDLEIANDAGESLLELNETLGLIESKGFRHSITEYLREQACIAEVMFRNAVESIKRNDIINELMSFIEEK